MPRFDPIATPHDFSVIDLGNRDQLLAVGEEVFKAATSPTDLANFILNAKSILQQPNLAKGLDPKAVAGKSINVVVDTDDVINVVIPQVQTTFKDPAGEGGLPQEDRVHRPLRMPVGDRPVSG
ncbi:hypothetical protein QFZ27_005421 [Inquilinus ginsengisoli]|uniref:hypothetical protein n=1 Tax=Inquilinus ginsengisoli TaxID=363840 RepID=UPI003D1AAD95